MTVAGRHDGSSEDILATVRWRSASAPWEAWSDDTLKAGARQLRNIYSLPDATELYQAGFTSRGASLDCSCTFSVQILPPPPVGIFDLANRSELFYILKQWLTAVGSASHASYTSGGPQLRHG